jgi:hypothetical protein
MLSGGASLSAVKNVAVALLSVASLACASITEPTFAIPEDADGGRIRVMIPEVYELANVILATTDFGTNDANAI